MDPRGCQGPVPFPLDPISFIFMQFSGNIWPNNSLAPPPWGLVPPPIGNLGSATDEHPMNTAPTISVCFNAIRRVLHSTSWKLFNCHTKTTGGALCQGKGDDHCYPRSTRMKRIFLQRMIVRFTSVLKYYGHNEHILAINSNLLRIISLVITRTQATPSSR